MAKATETKGGTPVRIITQGEPVEESDVASHIRVREVCAAKADGVFVNGVAVQTSEPVKEPTDGE